MELIASHPKEIFLIAEEFNNKKKTLKDLNKIIEKLSLDQPKDEVNTFKGDMLEIVTCVFFNVFGCDPSVGLIDYKPICIENDYGVDGIGINANGTEVAVQVKYRKNSTTKISYSDIARTYTSGRLELKLNLEKKDSIYVFTNAEDVTSPCQKVFGNIIKVLNNKAIDHYIRNNKSFWSDFYNRIYDYLD